MKSSDPHLSNRCTSAEPFIGFKTDGFGYFARTLNFSQVIELDNLIGGGGGVN